MEITTQASGPSGVQASGGGGSKGSVEVSGGSGGGGGGSKGDVELELG